MKKGITASTPFGKKADDEGLGRREFLVKAAKGAFLVSMGSVFTGCDEELYHMANELAPDDGTSAMEGETFYFAVLSDTHIKKSNTSIQNQIMALTVKLLNGYSPAIDFAIITGDCVDSLPSNRYDWYLNHTTELDKLADFQDQMTMPLYPVMGNHDYYTQSVMLTPGKEIREQVFMEKLGTPGPYYAVEHKGVKFYLLNSMQNDPNTVWQPDLVGSFGPEQISWLEEELRDDKPAFFFHHHPLATEQTVVAGFSGLARFPFEIPCAEAQFSKYESWKKIYDTFGSVMDALRLGDFDYTDPIYHVLKENNDQIKAVFFGHTHLFLKDTCYGVPVYMTDAMKFPRFFLYDQTDTMRFHIVECGVDTGNYRIHNEVSITYMDEFAMYANIGNDTEAITKQKGVEAFIKTLKAKGVNEEILSRL